MRHNIRTIVVGLWVMPKTPPVAASQAIDAMNVHYDVGIFD
jgi:hypothetical protein